MELKWPGEELVGKLWETLAEKGVGGLLKPWQMAREGKASNEVRRQEILMLAQANADAAAIASGEKFLDRDGQVKLLGAPDQNDSGRVEPTIDLAALATVASRQRVAAEARTEINASKAILYAEQQLLNDSAPLPETSIDADWLYTWRDYAGRVSAESLQIIWGRILAGELKAPGNYSLRTLEFLRGISQAEAATISKVARVVIEGRVVKLNDASDDQEWDKFQLQFGDFLRAQELGLLLGVDSIGLESTFKSLSTEKFHQLLRSNGKALRITSEEVGRDLNLSVYIVTALGREVFGLGDFEPCIEYLTLLGQKFSRQGFKVQLGDWHNINKTHGRLTNEISIEV